MGTRSWQAQSQPLTATVATSLDTSLDNWEMAVLSESMFYSPQLLSDYCFVVIFLSLFQLPGRGGRSRRSEVGATAKRLRENPLL